jgi:hypothetical protein
MATAVPVDPNEATFIPPPPGTATRGPTPLIPPPATAPPAAAPGQAPAWVQQYQNITGHPLANYPATGTPPDAPAPMMNPSQTLAPPTPGTGADTKANAPALPSAPPPAAPPQTPGQRAVANAQAPPSPAAAMPAPAPSGDLQAYGQAVAAKYGIPWDIFYYQIQGENSWQPTSAPNQFGAQGIAQFIPSTARQYGVDVNDPRSSLDGAGRYMADLYRQTGSWTAALTAYLTGKTGIPPPAEVLRDNHAYATAYHNAGYTANDARWQGFVDDAQAGYRQKAADASAAMGEALKQIKAGDITLGEAMTRIRAAQDKADDAQQTALQAIAQQPKAPVMDGVKHLSGLATIVGVLGGLLTRQPMLASLNAGAAAIEAYNSGDLRNYQLAHDNWKNQTDLLFKIAGMQAQRVHDVMGEEDIPIQWQHAKLDSTLRAMDLGMVADQARIEGSNVALDWAYKIDQAQLERERYQREYDKPILTYDKNTGQYANVYPLSGKIQYLPKGFTPQTAAGAARGNLAPAEQAELDRRNALIDPSLPQADQDAQAYKNYLDVVRQGAVAHSRASPYGEVRNIKVTDDSGKVIFNSAAYFAKDGTGWHDSSTNEPVPQGKIEVERQADSGAAGGRQQAAQLTAIRGAANEAVGSLQNLVEMPITANLGSFMGLQYQTPDSLAEALKRTTARTLTPQEQNDLGITFSGVGRSLATLEAQGRASGLVGLAGQMEKLAPQTGDTPLTVMRRYAEIRQIIERSIENAKASGLPDSEASKLLDKIADQARTAVPWTVHDVNQIAYGDANSVRQVAEKILAGRVAFQQQQRQLNPPPDAGKTQQNPAYPPTPEDVDKLPPGTYYVDPRDPKNVRHTPGGGPPQ